MHNRHCLPEVNHVQATNVSLILHLHYKDLCIIDRYLKCKSTMLKLQMLAWLCTPKKGPVYIRQVPSISQLCSSYKCHIDSKPTLQGPVYNRQVASKSQLCWSYKCQIDSKPTLQEPVYNGQVSSKLQLCSSYKCQFDSTLTLQDPFYNGQVSSISQLCSNFKLMSVWFYIYITRTSV